MQKHEAPEGVKTTTVDHLRRAEQREGATSRGKELGGRSNNQGASGSCALKGGVVMFRELRRAIVPRGKMMGLAKVTFGKNAAHRDRRNHTMITKGFCEGEINRKKESGSVSLAQDQSKIRAHNYPRFLCLRRMGGAMEGGRYRGWEGMEMWKRAGGGNGGRGKKLVVEGERTGRGQIGRGGGVGGVGV